MPRVSVLIPTHDHAETLPLAVASVQAQGVADLEILICGDGVNDALRTVAQELSSADPRIRFFDLPKAPRVGELNRDQVLRQARGKVVCYQSDDDLWLPGHLAAMETALENADFAGAMQVNVDVDGKIHGYYFDLERPEFVEPWLAWKQNGFGPWASNGFGLSFAAHRLDAYLRLPEGWSTTPAGLPTDQTMWHKFFRHDWCRARFLRWPVALHFAAPGRKHWSPGRRGAELKEWSAIVAGREGMGRILHGLLPDLGDRFLEQSLEFKKAGDYLAAARDREAAWDKKAGDYLAAARDREAAWESRLAAERSARLAAEGERDAVLSSNAWRLTGPLRTAINALKRFRSPRDA
jgi:glycosyltransferase involved in cell wall biosynthesis